MFDSELELVLNERSVDFAAERHNWKFLTGRFLKLQNMFDYIYIFRKTLKQIL